MDAPSLLLYQALIAERSASVQRLLTPLEWQAVWQQGHAWTLAQAVAVLRLLGVPDDAEHVNPNGGAIALGHPLGASGARLATAALLQLERTRGRYALCTMCIGVGQGIALVMERV